MIITNNRTEESNHLLKESNGCTSTCSNFYPFLRQGLFLFLKNSKFKSVALPYYAPEGLYDPFLSNGYKIYFYDIDENGFIDNKIFLQTVDIFVYIHYFGIYNFENIKNILKNKKSYKIFIEDFAHTVYSNSLTLSGDLCTFSFTKVIGVNEGSCIFFNKIDKITTYYTENTIESFFIKIDLIVELYSNSYLNNKFSILAKISRKLKYILGISYYILLMKSYRITQPELGNYSKKIIHKIDFNKISKIRIKYAKLYFDNIDEELLFKIPREFYCHQALFAFPIKIEKRDEIMRLLDLNDIKAFYLSNNWSFGNMKNKDFCNKHLLLPINHNLHEHDIMKVIKCINNIFLIKKNDK
jgi:hypothetical protein